MAKKIDTSHLTEMQKNVTLSNGTEPPYANPYWNNHKPGIYVDIIDGTPLFASTAKFDSGCGWPSFSRPIDESNITKRFDSSHALSRIEVRSKESDAHLGHVFRDGPIVYGGLRYCINSASLRFIPLDELEAQGYGQYKSLFEKK